MSPPADRRLAAIVFSDIVGYTARMAASEAAGLRARTRHRDVFAGAAARYQGQIVDENGDELVLVFGSALDAVNASLAVLEELRGDVGDDVPLELRVGVHSGDVVFEGGRIYGDGVNVAARIRPFAEAGGLCVSDTVHDSIKNQPDLDIVDLGVHELKNVSRPVAVFAVSGTAAPPRTLPVATPDGRRRTVRRIAAPLAGLAVLVAVAFAAWTLRPDSSPVPIEALAVLPLENLSGDPEQDYFADGLTEALIGDLAQIEALRVISRTSIMQYKNARKPLPEIARELGVQAVVEGTVARSGDRVRVTAQLIEAATDHHLWAKRYERDLEDVLELQSDIAMAIAGEVHAKLSSEEMARMSADAPEVDPEVHDEYLRGRHFLHRRSVGNLRRAIGHFERVVELDPNHARAWAALADARLLLPFYSVADPRTGRDGAEAAALRALELDPELAEGWTSLGFLRATVDWDFAASKAAFQRALELDPGYSSAGHWYGLTLLAIGRVEEGIAVLERARAIDPLAPAILSDLGLGYLIAGREADARRNLEEALELVPGFELALGFLSELHLERGEPELALDFARQATEISPALRWRISKARAQVQLGEGDAARATARELLDRSERDYLPLYRLAQLYWDLGETALALDLLERSFDERDPLIIGAPIPFDPQLRASSRFQDILARHGFRSN